MNMYNPDGHAGVIVAGLCQSLHKTRKKISCIYKVNISSE
jgi:hypothetical protein